MTPNIGDQNVERLLAAAYQPETPDPAFVASVEAHLCATAQELAAARSQPPMPDELCLRTVRRRLAWAMGMAAAIAVVALALHAGSRQTPEVAKQGVKADRTALVPVVFGNETWKNGMTARTRRTPPAVQPLAVGETLTTTAGQRRRLTLADGSVVYLNQNTSVTQAAPRQLQLTRGEIYLEVAPRPAGSDGATFLVKTPTREVAALGTRFAVDVNADGTGVVVTQGTVKVSGLEKVLRAGQQVAPGALRIAPAPRASYVLDWTRELMAAAESPLVPGSKHAGGALVAVDPSGQEVSLTLRKYHLDVHIEDGFARTTIDQTYFNHEYGRLEGTFYFPLPADAALSRLAMYVEENGSGRLMEGGMAERDHARNVFETIRYTQRDPALLEWVDGSTFKMRVFPLEGRKEKRLILSYTQKLASLYGKTTYRFPTGHSLRHDLSFRGRIKHGAALSWDSATPLQASREGDDLILTTAKNAALDRDLVLSLSAPGSALVREGEAPAEPSRAARQEPRPPIGPIQAEGVARFSSFTHEDAQYLMLRYRPRLASPPQRQRRDWVFLFESSANRDPLLARVQIDVIRTLLLNADHDDTFAVLTAGTRVHALARERQPVTPENIQTAVEFLEGTHLIGALDLEQALQAAGPLLKGATNPYLVHVGAGLAAIGERNPDVLAKAIPDGVHYVGVGIGKRWSRAFMKLAADRSGGACTQINPDESVTWRAFDLLATLNTPRLMDVRVVDNDEKVTFLTDANAVSQGEEMCAIARLDRRAGGVNPLIPAHVTLSGKVDGKPFVRELAVKNIAANAGYLPRQWAKLEIDRLLADGGDKNRPRIVELSKAMYVMSPFTSLLVLETDADYARFKVDRGRKDHWAMYACPERIPVVYEPLAQAPVAAPPPVRKDGKKSVAEVLQTIVVRMPPRFLHLPNSGDVQRRHAHGFLATMLSVERSALPFSDEPPVYFPPLATWKALTALRRDKYETDPALQDPLLTWDVNPEATDPGMDINYPVERIFRVSVPGIVNPDQPIGIVDGDKSNPPSRLPPPPGWGGGQAGGIAGFTLYGGAPFARYSHGLTFPSDFTVSDGTVYRLAPLAGSFYGRSGAFKGSRSPVSVDSLKDLGVIVISGNNPADTEEVIRLIKQLEQAPPDTTAPVKVVSVKGVDPQLVQQALDAIQGRRASIQWSENTLGFYPPALALVVRGDSRIHTKVTGGVLGGAHAYLETSVKRKLEAQARLDRLDRLRSNGRSFVAAEDYAAAILMVDRYRYEEEAARVALIQAGELPIITGPGVSEAFTPAFARSLLYERPAFTGDVRVFSDVASYAPGMNTSNADIFAVLEMEATPTDSLRVGKIDDGAKMLIDRARQGRWQVLTVPARGGQAGYKVVFNSAGQFAFTRTLQSGLRETVVCDGTTLLYLYPELGTGAQRKVSRFHRAAAADLIPWVLPPVEDFARGADVVSIDKTTVAIVPHKAGTAKGSDGKPHVSLQARLLFTADGRLAERQLVQMPGQKILFRETYDQQGTIKHLDPVTAKVLGEQRLTLTPAKAPNLHPDTSRLVVLPMPLRTREHVIQAHQLDPNARWAKLNADAALQLFAADWATSNNEATRIFSECFHAKADRRIGFHTLLADPGKSTAPGGFTPGGNGGFTPGGFGGGNRGGGAGSEGRTPGRGSPAVIDVAAEHPQEPLARYLAFNNDVVRGAADKELGDIGGPADGFVQRLAAFRTLWMHWTSGKATAGDAAAKKAERTRAVTFVRECRVPAFALAILGEMWRNGGFAKDADVHQALAVGYEHLAKVPGLGYLARYECARNLLDAGERKEAAKRFVDLYNEVRKTGGLPRIDASFPEAFRWANIDQPPFAVLMRRTAAELAKEKRHGAILTLAWQCSQVGEQVVADELFGTAVAGVSGSRRQAFILSQMMWLWQTGQLARADMLLQGLLADAKLARRPDLWRMAAALAEKRGMLARSVTYLDKALGLEYQSLPETVNLQTVRSDYGGLLEQYQKLAVAIAMLDNEPRRDLLAKVIRAADRWRSLDSDNTAACQAAAKVLQTLGARDLAWEYLTTPIGLNPNEAAPWLNLAQTLRGEGQVDLADRAYALAFAAESTNAQILWDRAQHLQQAGRFDQAFALYRQLADGMWQPRFQGLVQQARGLLNR